VRRALALFIAIAPALGAQPATDSLLDRASRAYASARTLRAVFQQTLTNPDTKDVRTSRGDFVQQGPARFALRFTDPNGDAIVSDGTFLWVYIPSGAPGQVIKLPVAAGANLDFLTQLVANPRASYAVSAAAGDAVDGRATSVFLLTPKKPSTPFTSAKLWIDREDALVRQVETVEPSGLRRRVRFSNLRADTDLPADALTFIVPKGVKVIDQAALFGGRPNHNHE